MKLNKLLSWAALAACWTALSASNCMAATITWSSNDGTFGDTTLWSNDDNWVGGAAPTDFDDVVIGMPVALGNRVTNNDLPAGTQINGIAMGANLNEVNGNSINLGGNVSYTAGGTSIGKIGASVVLLQDTTYSNAANTSNGRLEIGGGISGNFSLTKADAGRLRFVGTAKTYTGSTIVTGGLLDMSANDMVPFGAGKGDVYIGTGAQFVINNVNTQINGLNDYAGGAGAVNKSGSNSRSLTLGNGDANGSFSGAMNMTGTGGTGSTINKVGAGTQTLSGLITVPGAGSVSGGRLNIDGTWTGSLIVNANGTLGGNGSITGSVTGLGTVAPGSSIGDLTVGSAILGGTFEVELDGTGSGSSDLLNVLGALDITAATVDFDELVAVDDAAYIFASYGSLVGATFVSAVDLPAGYEINYAYNGNNIALVQIPEPASLVLLACAACGAWLRRK
jgi:autotransporter-associated beta strand protein